MTHSSSLSASSRAEELVIAQDIDF